MPSASTPTDPVPSDPVPSSPGAWLREGGRPLIALLIAIAILKLLIVSTHEASNPLARHLTSDQAYYVDRAVGLTGAAEDPRATEPYHLPPLYPVFLAITPGIEFGDGTWARIIQSTLGLAALVGVYLFARRRTKRLGALVATALTAAYGPITFFELKLLGDTLAFDALVALLVAADAWHARPTTPRAALVGVLTGVTALLRPQALLLAVLLSPWMARRAWPAGSAFVIAFAVVLAPFAAHNLSASGDLILVSDNGGVNLWLANGEDAPVSGTFATNDREFGDIATQSDIAKRRAERALDRSLSAGEVSAHFRSRALSAIAAEPQTFLQRLRWRSLALVESFQTGIVAVPATERDVIAPLAILALPFGLLAALAAAATLLLGPRPWVSRPTDDSPRPSWVPALAIVAMVVITTLAFFHYERFRLIVVPLLATLIGMATDRVVQRQRVNPARAVGAALVAIAVVVISFLDAPHHAPTLANGYTSLGAAVLADASEAGIAGRQARATALATGARAWAEKALEHDPGFLRALLLHLRASLSSGDGAGARRSLETLDRIAPGLPDADALRPFVNALPR